MIIHDGSSSNDGVVQALVSLPGVGTIMSSPLIFYLDVQPVVETFATLSNKGLEAESVRCNGLSSTQIRSCGLGFCIIFPGT